MKKVLTLCAAVMIAASAMAADYMHSVGIAGGSGLGAQYKVMVLDDFTIIEEFGYYGCFEAAGKNGFNLGYFGAVNNLVLAYQEPVAEGQGIALDWYAGGQIRLGYVPGQTDQGLVGVGAVAGIEACMKNAPIAFSFDFRPGYACILADGGSAGNVGMGGFGPIQVGGGGSSVQASHFFDWSFSLGVRYKF